MTPDGNSLFDLLQLMMQKEPQVVSLLTAQSDSEFDIAFDSVLGKAIAHLEQNSKKFKQLDEEGFVCCSGCEPLNAMDVRISRS